MLHQVVFFGSFQNYSLQVLDALLKAKSCKLIASVTTPPVPKGRHLHLVKNETQIYSEKHNIPCYPLETIRDIPASLVQNPPDFIVVAGFGKIIHQPWLELPKIMSINMHPSLLPLYPGRCPAEWAILNGESETGVTLIKMSAKFDAGDILAQVKLPIGSSDTRLTLYSKLYDLGAQMLIATLPHISSGKITPTPQAPGDYFYARQITRADGFIPWRDFRSQITTHHREINLKFRGLAGWPGVWTINPDGKRIKLIALNPEVLVQEEGKSPTPWLS